MRSATLSSVFLACLRIYPFQSPPPIPLSYSIGTLESLAAARAASFNQRAATISEGPARGTSLGKRLANHSSQDAVNAETKGKKKKNKKKNKKGNSRSNNSYGNSGGDVHNYGEDDVDMDAEDDEAVSPAAVKEELEEEKATV